MPLSSARPSKKELNCMPPERLHPGLPSEWLRHARSDIFFAQNRLEEGMLETNCYHAQQSAEKSIKAVCVHRNIRFSYTHDLNRLMTELYPDLEGMPVFTKDLEALSGYAVSGRYPALMNPSPKRNGSRPSASPKPSSTGQPSKSKIPHNSLPAVARRAKEG